MTALSKLSIFNFLPPRIQSVRFQELIGENEDTTKELLNMSKLSVSAVSSSKLYLGGRIDSVSDAAKALCAFRTVCSEYVTDFDSTQVWKLMAPVVQLLLSPAGLQWGQEMGGEGIFEWLLVRSLQGS